MARKKKSTGKKRLKKKPFLETPLTRREFLKKGCLGIAGLAVAGYTIKNRVFSNLIGSPSLQTIPGSAPKALSKFSKKASYWRSVGEIARCELCPNECRLEVGDRGVCRTRVNYKGELYAVSYGNPCSVHTDPIEKKPLYHFLPASKAYSIATGGCNIRCKFCQNWEISQSTPESLRNHDLSPTDVVTATLKQQGQDSQVKTIAYTYSEPVAFYDYMLDTAKIANKSGVKNAVITAGVLKKEPLKELCRNVQAIKVDLKGFNERFYRDVCSAELSDVLASIKTIKKSGVWLEIVNLVVPTLNDDLDEITAMSRWVAKNTGVDTPLHFSRFHPQYKLKNLAPTPASTLLKAREIALDAGLRFVYIGNIATKEGMNTYCPQDGTLCIERKGYKTVNHLVAESCPKCGTRIPGVFY